MRRAITPGHLPPNIESEADEIVSLHLDGRDTVCFTEVVATCERSLMDWALARTGGNQMRAAELLQMSRTTLRSRLASLRAAAEKDALATGELEAGS